MAEERLYSSKELQELAPVFGLALKDLVFPHGENALLNDGTVRPTMASAIPTAPTNWSSSLPINKDNKAQGLTEIFTGQTDDTGTNPTTTCETPAKPGNLKVCRQALPFGMYHKGTQQVNVALTGTRKNWADVNRQFINQPNVSGNPWIPDAIRMNPSAVNTPLGKSMLEFGMSAMLDWAFVAWQGNETDTPAAARPGWIDEPTGLDRLIKTGYADSVTGVVCPAADSYVVSYNAAIGSAFVLELANAYRVAKMTAELVNMAMTQWEIVVHPRLRYPIIDNWACNYHTARCEPTEANNRSLNTETVTRLRDEMFRGNYLLIDGEQIPLRVDWGIAIAQNQATGDWTGDVYGVPRVWNGNPLVYWEIDPYDSIDTTEYTSDGFNQFRVTNGGLYLETFVRTRTCYEYQYNARPRIRLDYPFLAFRVDDVIVPNDAPFRGPFHDDPYFVNGGQYYRA